VDVVYIVRPGEENDELRYSLRSLANLPHNRVWIVGHRPAWLQGVEFIRGNTAGVTVAAGRANVYNNVRLAADCDDMTEQVVIFNDDFFVTEPVDEVPIVYRSTLTEHIVLPRVQRNKGWWLESLMAARTCLQAYGFANPLSYELHMPFLIDRARMSETLALFQHVVTGESAAVAQPVRQPARHRRHAARRREVVQADRSARPVPFD
jgi:hypothetical protein